MRHHHDDADEGFLISFSDVVIALLAVVTVMFIIRFMMPSGVDTASHVTGSLCAELTWDDDRDIDLDLWGESPDSAPVGYTNMHSRYLHLYRDVLGFYMNPGHKNIEVQCSDIVAPGEWTFNVIYFGDHTNTLNSNPITARVTLTFQTIHDNKSVQKRILTRTKVLDQKQEVTFFNFIIDKNNQLVEESVNDKQVYMHD